MSLGYKFTFDLVPPDRDRIFKFVHRILIRTWKDSVKEFVKATAEAMEVDTGMSVASLEPLAREVRLSTLIQQIARGKGPKRGHSGVTGRFSTNNGIPKSFSSGQELGQKQNGAFELTFGTPVMPDLTFVFNIVVFQHFLNENGLGNNNVSSWNSLEKGQAAFLNFFEPTILKRLDGDRIAGAIIDGTPIE